MLVDLGIRLLDESFFIYRPLEIQLFFFLVESICISPFTFYGKTLVSVGNSAHIRMLDNFG